MSGQQYDVISQRVGSKLDGTIFSDPEHGKSHVNATKNMQIASETDSDYSRVSEQKKKLGKPGGKAPSAPKKGCESSVTN